MPKNKELKGENLEAENLAKWLRWNNYKFSHIANESGLPPRIAMLSAMRKKRMGVSPGVPDYLIVLKRGSLLFIELKKPRNKKENGEYYALSTDNIEISEHQKQWIESLSRIDNVESQICFGCQEAINLIELLENK